MKLEGKKALAAKALGVSKGRIVFNSDQLSKLKEAITRQDIRDLSSEGAILIKDKKGRRKNEKRKTRRRAGSIKKNVRSKKKIYMILVRKLRKHLFNLRLREKILREDYLKLRREIRASSFRSLSHMKERISAMEAQ